MSAHVSPDGVDYRKLFHRRAMEARARMGSMAARLTKMREANAQTEEKARAHRRTVDARRGFIYEAPIGPQQPVFVIIGTLSPEEQAALAAIRSRSTVHDLQKRVCRATGVSMMELLSERRTGNLCLVRQIAMWMAKTKTTRSYPDIGRRFGGRDHTTVMHAVTKIDRLVAKGDENVLAIIAAIEAEAD